ncbi:centromere protein P-like [Asterias amurensis]|uniref:centromere protein P-like n=1 Tax=Asterias amurensis TaxID=7602 RepID=UPI003AB4F1BC
MAASSDADIFEEANRALQGFNDDGDHDDQLDNCLAAMTTVKESKDRYSAEIERLREEVAHLEVQVEEDEQRLLEIQMTTLDRIQSSLQLGSNVTDQSTQDHLHLQGSFTGIQYTDATVKVIKKDSEQITRQHCLQGECSGLTFQADFKVEEKTLSVTAKESLPSPSNQETRNRITSLSIKIDDRALWELEEFVREAEKSRSLQPFLKGYGQYAQRFVARQKALEHFKRQYPDEVTLPQGSYGSSMKFGSHNGAMYTVVWGISVSTTGRADQQIVLQVTSSKQMRRLDEQKVLTTAPEKFQQMLQRLGIEKTIDTFIQAVTTT